MLRVVARYQRRMAAVGEGKFIGRDARLTWWRHGWKLEELPQKGKRKLRLCELK